MALLKFVGQRGLPQALRIQSGTTKRVINVTWFAPLRSHSVNFSNTNVIQIVAISSEVTCFCVASKLIALGAHAVQCWRDEEDTLHRLAMPTRRVR
jgi:hypothetical protein